MNEIAHFCAVEVWIVYGDGSLGYSVAEFDTFTRHKVKSPKPVSSLSACKLLCYLHKYAIVE